MKGKLYIVGTPIGNLEDISYRAIRILNEVDLIAAEDTRQTFKLLNHYNIKKEMMSYHKYNEKERSDQLIHLIKQGKNIALLSDAGMPIISDPGSILIARCIKEEISYTSIPGPTALTTAVALSGIEMNSFLFLGFLPKKKSLANQTLARVRDYPFEIVLYESPHALLTNLGLIKKSLGNRRVIIARELTKLYEEVISFNLEEAINYYKERPPRGEFVLIIAGKSQEELDLEEVKKWEGISYQDHYRLYEEEGLKRNEIYKKIAEDRRISKREVYARFNK